MKIKENQCVDCELRCIYESCPYYSVTQYVCDKCEHESAAYRIAGEDYCEDCAISFLQEEFDELTIAEKAELLDVYIEKIN